MVQESEKVRDAVNVFADLVGSARMSDVLQPGEYDKLVNEFHEKANKVLTALNDDQTGPIIPEGVVCDGGIRGDEVVHIMTVKKNDPSQDLLSKIAAVAPNSYL